MHENVHLGDQQTQDFFSRRLYFQEAHERPQRKGSHQIWPKHRNSKKPVQTRQFITSFFKKKS